jgi:hypothetical protein
LETIVHTSKAKASNRQRGARQQQHSTNVFLTGIEIRQALLNAARCKSGLITAPENDADLALYTGSAQLSPSDCLVQVRLTG